MGSTHIKRKKKKVMEEAKNKKKEKDLTFKICSEYLKFKFKII
jgi:hypothetical protein